MLFCSWQLSETSLMFQDVLTSGHAWGCLLIFILFFSLYLHHFFFFKWRRFGTWLSSWLSASVLFHWPNESMWYSQRFSSRAVKLCSSSGHDHCLLCYACYESCHIALCARYLFYKTGMLKWSPLAYSCVLLPWSADGEPSKMFGARDSLSCFGMGIGGMGGGRTQAGLESGHIATS